MSLRINQNVVSLSTYSNLNRTTSRVDSSIKKLSSGLRINSAADDAAGLAISEKMRSQIRGLNRAKLNGQDGMSMLQTAEGGLNESESILQRMRELAIQASNDTLTTNDRLEIQKEVNQLRDALDDIADTTEFNTKKLLNGSQTALISSSSHAVKGIAVGAGSNGGDYAVSMALVEGGISMMQTSQLFTDKNTGDLAQGNTMLEDIEQFYDENGIFVIQTPQILTVTGNAQSTTFTLDAKMTLNDLAASIQNALASASALGIKNSSATVISTVQSRVSGLGGYIQITSGKIGDVGDFSIAGDQSVIDALGLTVSRESANNLVSLNLKDAYGNSRNMTTSTDRASGLLDGIDLKFDSQAAQISGNGGIVDGLKFSVAQNLQFRFSVGSVAVNVTSAFAANEKYSMEGIAVKINADIEAVQPLTGMEANVVDGQIRLSYNPNNSKSPTTIDILAGSDTLGFLVGNYNGFVDGEKNQDSEIKGFSQLVHNPADASVAMSINITDDKGNAYALSAGTTMTAGADLIEIEAWLVSANKNLQAASVAARVDAVNGSIAFTSTYIGDFNRNNASAYESLIVVSSTGTINDILGYRDGTAKGDGDTNYRLHVVDRCPQFQIGANAGQNMTVNICDMSSAALGVDKLDMSCVANAQKALAKVDKALSIVSGERSKLGAFENRLQYTISNLESSSTNLTESESRIRDLDMASEMTEFSSAQVLQQAGTAMLAQANSSSQMVLQLLQ